MCWTPLYVSKHKQHKQYMIPPTNNWTLRRTAHRFHTKIVTDMTIQNSERKDT